MRTGNLIIPPLRKNKKKIKNKNLIILDCKPETPTPARIKLQLIQIT